MRMDAAAIAQLIAVAVADAVEPLKAEIAGLKAQLTEAEAEIAHLKKTNSTNSHKPSSTDGLQKPAPKPLRTPSGKKSGGQPNHPGTTLHKSENPDFVVEHHPRPVCDACGNTLPEAALAETRQVFDIPEPKFEVTEHRAFAARCACGKIHCGAFPPEAAASLQYGPNAKALAVHLTQHHMLPVARTGELFGDLFGMPLSDATILKMRDEAAEKLKPTAQAIGEAVLESPVIHPDETGMRAVTKLHWLHVVATTLLTWIGAHAKRGAEAMNAAGILPRYKGVAVHDCWGSYWDYDFDHAVCNAHIGRELVFVHEVAGQKWAKQLKSLLWAANREVKQDGDPLNPERLSRYHAHYDRLVAQGKAKNPPPPIIGKKKRGRPKKGKIGSLVARLEDLKDAVWRFATVKGVPFTNNLAEQAVRMPKVKQKVSGCFRTKKGLDAFCTIRTIAATVKKQGGDVLEVLTAAFRGQPVALRLA